MLNIAIPSISKILVEFESYDLPETTIKQEIFRNYFSKFFNFTLYIVLNSKLVKYAGFIDDIFGTQF
jgi:hypothetical protein